MNRGQLRGLTQDRYVRLVIVWLVLSLVRVFTQPVIAQGRQEGVGPANGFFPVHDFQNDFVVYDEAFKAYVPFILEQHADEQAVSAFVDLESNRRYKLLIQSKQDGFLFVDAALRRKCPAGQWVVLDIDSLHRLYRKPQVFITLYGPAVVNNWQLLIGHARAMSQQTIRLNDDLLSVRPRPLSGFIDFFSVGLLFLLASHAFLYTFFRRGFLTYYSPLNLVRLDPPDESSLISRPLGGVSMAFTLNLSLGLAFLFLYVQSQHISLFGAGAFLPQGQTFGQLLLSYLAVTAVVFGLMLGKYALIATVGSLYKFDSIVSLHYFRIVEASLVFTTILLLLTAAISPYSSNFEPSPSLVVIPFIVYYLGRLGWLYLTLVRQMPVKNLYLFSYLCIVELIPLVIGIRFAV
ncbi:hypothetical protein FAES_1934 [Fibrella aestuarina BUZ 2]|uniref:DUF4271 domain-containing protein n=1 Tax=Fibrella aestuarina BUZ 2 TaxID=1166018 RepID=I0K740_9BACT|nr:hypothetical protein FAES_1934 [Fibrella aestuarina BUZ 2]